MAETLPPTKYEVSAFLRLRGNFAKQMERQTKAVPRMSRALGRMASMAEDAGRRMSGSFAGVGNAMRSIAMLGGAGATAGMGMLIKGGAMFNYQMEQAKLNIGTMYQLFGQAQGALGGTVDDSEAWLINLALAERTMKNFMVLQRQTPAGAADLVQLYQSAASGLAQTGAALERQEKFVTSMSLLGPALDNDFRQIGADVSRMLTGGAGMDVRTWTILRSNIESAAKELGFIKKSVKDADDITKAWNKNLTQAQKLKALEKAISALGPAIKKTFGESMGGLITTTSSNLKTLKGSFAQPLYDGFRLFLKRANSDKSSIFGERAMGEWMKVLTRYGKVLAKGAERVYSAIERGSAYLLENGAIVGEYIKQGFEAGMLIVKAMLARMIFNAMMGPILSGAGRLGGLRGKGGEMAEWWKKLGGQRQGMHTQMALGMRRGSGKGAAGWMGQKMGNVLGRGDGFGFLRGLEKALLSFASMGLMMGVLAAKALLVGTVLAGLVIVFGALGTIIAGIAAYIVEKWDEIAKAIRENIWTIRAAMWGMVKAGLRLWYGLVMLGEQFVGGKKSVDLLVMGINAMTWAIEVAAKVFQFFINIVSLFKKMVGGMKLIFSSFYNMLGAVMEKIPGMGEEARKWRGYAKDWRASAAEDIRQSDVLGNLADKFGKIQAQGTKAITPEMINEKVEKMSQGLLDLAAGPKKKRKVPPSGIHVNNMYHQWDLRNTDPDRVMAAFIPRVNRLANKRTQAYDMTEQGV